MHTLQEKIPTFVARITKILIICTRVGGIGSHCVKSVRIWSYFDVYFSAFGLNTDQSECGKTRNGIISNTDSSYAVPVFEKQSI